MAEEARGSSPAPRRAGSRRGKDAEPMLDLATREVADVRSAKFAAAEHKRHIELEKLAHDQQMERDDAILRRRREWALLVASLAAGGAACCACVLVLFLRGSSDDLRKSALAGLFSLMTAALGFLAGKGSRKD